MSGAGSAGRPRPGGAAPDAQEAMSRAARHARNAASEGVLAARALLDALALLQAGTPADSHTALSRIAGWLERIAAGLAGDGGHDAALTRALAEALDAEIERWEQRAREDPDARAVLRAFLGVRELLWELGVRPPPQPGGGPAQETPRPRPKPRRKRRVERVPVRADPPDPLG